MPPHDRRTHMPKKISNFLKQTALVLGWIISIFSVSLGITILLAPENAVYRDSLRDAFIFAPPHIWAIGWMGLGVWTILALIFHRVGASLPLYINGVLTASFGFFTVPTLADGSGGVFGVYTFCALAACSLLAGHNIGDEGD